MRSAEIVVRDVRVTPLHSAVKLIEADRRAAKLEVLRELSARYERGEAGLGDRMLKMIASLETEAAEPAKEET